MPFEVLPMGFSATDIVATVQDAAGAAPSNVIRTDSAWSVKVEFSTDLALSGVLPGEWVISVYLESIGQGDEIKCGTKTIPLQLGGSGLKNYSEVINVAAGTVSLAPGENSTPFKLVTTVTYNWPTNPPTPGPMAGFSEGPIVQFYKPA